MVDKPGGDVDGDSRIAQLERRTEGLTERIARLEEELAAARVDAPPRFTPPGARPSALAPERPDVRRPPAPLAPPRAARPSAPPSGTRAARPSRASLEDLVAGRVLAWAGGAAVFVGLVLLVAVAISRGWIGEGARTVIAGAFSLVLVAVGAWLQERRGPTDAAMAAAAAGIGGLFATSVVAVRLYDLVPVGAGLALALATGAAALALAVRWESRGMAALGIVGGLASPVLVGAPAGGGTTAILFVATLAASGVCVLRGWDWLGLAAFGVVTPQWLAGLSEEPVSGATATLVLAGFGALFAVAGTGHDLRTRAGSTSARAIALLVLNAFVLAGPGWVVVDEHGGTDAANVWLACVAGAHLAGGLALLRAARASRTLVVAALAIGVIAADAALIQVLDDLPLVLVWSAAVAGFAAVARLAKGSAPAERLAAGGAGRLADAALGTAVAGHLALAVAHVLLFEAPPEAIAAGEGTGGAGVAAIAAACVAAAALLAARPAWRDPLAATALAAAMYLAAILLDGVPLVVCLAAGAAFLAEAACRARGAAGEESRPAAAAPLRGPEGPAEGPAAARGAAGEGSAPARGASWPDHPLDVRAAAAAAVVLGAALAHALSLEAPPRALIDGLGDLGAAAVALGATACAAWAVVRAARWPAPAVAVVPLYLASVTIVTVAGADDDAQMLLSALWASVGVVALIAGLVRDHPTLRTAALALIAAALTKVFLYDLATLTALARVASFLALGLLLLGGAFAWQRIRPPDSGARPEAHG